MKQFIWGATMIALTGLVACGNSNNTDSKDLAEDINERNLDGTVWEDDAEFAVWAADEGLTVVRVSELAAARAENPQVKQLASAIVGDHTKAINELKALAETKGIVLPVVPSNENQNDYERLAGKSGSEFEKEYVDYTVRNHKKLVDKFRDEADEAGDPDVRSWINAQLPVWQEHLQQAESAQEVLKNNK